MVARFLALLELYKDGQVRFEQVLALGELQVTWTGSESGLVAVSDELVTVNAPPAVKLVLIRLVTDEWF